MADRRLRRQLAAIDENLAAKPDSALVEYLRIPDKYVSPVTRIARRLFYALAALFTDDAVWDGGPMGAHHGREAIRRFFQGSSTRVAFALHMVLNPQIEVDGDIAQARWYLWQPMVYRLPGGEQAWWMSARYDDRCVRTDQGWRFARVQVALKLLAPYSEGWGQARLHDVYGALRGASS